jgi:cation diffusion facilitator CzcD-associated flavoprotein CzcO
VGGGNTGCQIAEDVAAAGSHEVHLAVGSRQIPLPQRLLAGTSSGGWTVAA